TSVNSITGVISISNALPNGTHTITVRATDNCGAVTDSQFILTVGLVINSVVPPAGQISGGQQVKLTGSFANLLNITVGGISASWIYTNGTSEVTLTTPAHSVGAVDIVLTPNSGSPYNKVKVFAYLPTSFTDNTL